MFYMADKIKGALYGVAVGDALGAPLEFMDSVRIAQQHGTVTDMIGGGWLNVLPGEITDDTQMTLAVAGGIIKCPDAPVEAVGAEFIKWYQSHPKDVGGTCSAAISRAMQNGSKVPNELEWFDAAQRTHADLGGKSAGNGTLMRTMYPGLYYRTYKERITQASAISRMTHFDEKSTNACMIYSAMVGLFTEGCISLQSCAELYIRDSGLDPDGLYNLSELGMAFIPQPTGYVVDSFRCALHCLLTTSSFEDAVVNAVNLGGDADTIGAIAGGLAGALYGFSVIPRRWVQTLDGKVSILLDSLTGAAEQHRWQ